MTIHYTMPVAPEWRIPSFNRAHAALLKSAKGAGLTALHSLWATAHAHAYRPGADDRDHAFLFNVIDEIEKKPPATSLDIAIRQRIAIYCLAVEHDSEDPVLYTRMQREADDLIVRLAPIAAANDALLCRYADPVAIGVDRLAGLSLAMSNTTDVEQKVQLQEKYDAVLAELKITRATSWEGVIARCRYLGMADDDGNMHEVAIAAQAIMADIAALTAR